MEQQSRWLPAEGAPDRREIGQVELRTSETGHGCAWREIRRGLDQIISDQAPGAGDPNRLCHYNQRSDSTRVLVDRIAERGDRTKVNQSSA